jgi:hypothetical protein
MVAGSQATMPPTLTPAAFAAKWRGTTTTEKAASQEHFIDLCRIVGEPTPHEADPTGDHYAFERRVEKAGGGDGFADVWKRDFFAWEYKGKRKHLKAAYVQPLAYKDDLGNPPLLIVSDLERIEIRTKFTSLSPVLTTITLEDLAADDPSTALQQLRDVFTAPDTFRPHLVPAQITEQAARKFAEIAQGLRARGHDPEAVAHFLDRILFCLFAEDAGLLPKGIFSRLSQASKGRSELFTRAIRDLFRMMANDGGLFGAEEIDWFNGGMFDSDEVLPLTGSEITTLLEVGRLNWALIEPAIFGTLFERGLDPSQRAPAGRPLYGPRVHLEAGGARHPLPAPARVRGDAEPRDRTHALRSPNTANAAAHLGDNQWHRPILALVRSAGEVSLSASDRTEHSEWQ